MNKADIRQIILEEIENAIDDMSAGDIEVTNTTPEDVKDLFRGLNTLINPTEDYLEEMAKGRTAETWYVTPKMDDLLQRAGLGTGKEGLIAAVVRGHKRLAGGGKRSVGLASQGQKRPQKSLFADEKGNLDIEKVKQFANILLKPEGFTPQELGALFPVVSKKTGESRPKDMGDFKRALQRAGLITFEAPGGEVEAPEGEVSESKKKLEFDFSQVETPEELPIDVEEQDLMDNIKKELKTSAEEYQNDDKKDTADKLKDAVSWVEKNGLTGKVTIGEIYDFLTEFHKQLPGNDKMFLHEPTILELVEDEFKPYVNTEEEYQEIVSSVEQYLSSKQPQTMSELEKYIKQVIREAKNPLAKRMKEIETQGRVAALETKLTAIAEMIEETEGRLTRIDEDNEFKEMMDRNAVRDVRKQLKELERAQAKLQKEYDKVSGGKKRETVVDELDAEAAAAKADKFDDFSDRQKKLDQEYQEAGEVEEVSFELNESVKRMQKLANLKG